LRVASFSKDNVDMVALAWAEIRRRWLPAAAMGLLLGIGFAAVLAAAAGARRTETAYSRMLEATRGPQLLVSSANPDASVRQQLYDGAAAVEGVEKIGALVAIEVIPVNPPKGEGTKIEACSHISRDGVFGFEIYRPNVIAGRLPRADRSDEVLVSHSWAKTFGVGVGNDLTFVKPPGSAGPASGAGTAAEPVGRARIVGVGVFGAEVVPLSDLDRAPRIFAGPAFASRYAPTQDDHCYDGAVVAVRGSADLDKVAPEIEQVGGPEGYAVIQDLSSNYADVRRAIQPQVTALWLFAVAAAVSTVLVVGQLQARQLQEATRTAVPVWRALGATRRLMLMLVTAPSVVTATVGGLVALAGAWLLSGRFPIGPARLAEPDAGPALHAAIHLGGTAAVVAIQLLIGLAAAVLASKPRAEPRRVGGLAPIAAATPSPAVLVGIQLATGPRRSGATVPVRSAAASVSLAVAAAIATITFAGALDTLVSQPDRYGQDWDVVLDGEFSPVPIKKVLAQLEDRPAVASIAGGRYGEVIINGARVPTAGLSDLVGDTFPAIIDGRAPSAPDEIVLGKRTLRDLHASIGKTVSVDLGEGAREMTVVGTAAFPRINRGSFGTLGLGVGAMTVTEAFPPYDFASLGEAPPGADPSDFIGPGDAAYEFVTIRIRPHATRQHREEVLATVRQLAEENVQVVRTEQRPIAIDNYAAVRSTPVVLAILLGSMAAATLAHLVAIVVRRRRRDIAVCAALGMQRSQLSGAVVIQGVLVVGSAMVVGVPVGIVAGRISWRIFASNIGVLETLSVPLLPIGIACVIILGLAVAVSAVPAVAAARTRPALVLRSE